MDEDKYCLCPFRSYPKLFESSLACATYANKNLSRCEQRTADCVDAVDADTTSVLVALGMLLADIGLNWSSPQDYDG